MSGVLHYLSTWQGPVHVAFVVEVYIRQIVDWKVSGSMHTDFVLDALEQALHARPPFDEGDRIRRSDRGSQFLPIRHTFSANWDTTLASPGLSPGSFIALFRRSGI